MAFSARVSDDVIARINVTPLVDVLLVLLIIFMITAPIVTHKATMDLPHPSNLRLSDATPPIRLVIHADGGMAWNDRPIGLNQLDRQLSIAAIQTEQPAIRIEAADSVAYETFARVLAKAKAQGMRRIDIVDVQ